MWTVPPAGRQHTSQHRRQYYIRQYLLFWNTICRLTHANRYCKAMGKISAFNHNCLDVKTALSRRTKCLCDGSTCQHTVWTMNHTKLLPIHKKSFTTSFLMSLKFIDSTSLRVSWVTSNKLKGFKHMINKLFIMLLWSTLLLCQRLRIPVLSTGVSALCRQTKLLCSVPTTWQVSYHIIYQL